jgi:large subunit ribosomal protein L13
MKTYQPKQKEISRGKHELDAADEVLGRLASKAAMLLMGKHKPTYSPHIDMGDHVVILNATKVNVSGKKSKQKVYQKHSGYPGGLKTVKFEKLKAEQPEKIIEHAVGGMLPKNKLQTNRMKRLIIKK